MAKALIMLKFGVNILQIMRATIMRHRAVWVSKPLCLLSVITRQVTMGFKKVHKMERRKMHLASVKVGEEGKTST